MSTESKTRRRRASASSAAREQLLNTYAARLEPLVEKAKRAYGSRSQSTEAHRASRQYTKLVAEYYARGGSIQQLATRLGVTYAGLRRRIMTANLAMPARPRRRSLTPDELTASVSRVADAKTRGTSRYHAQVYKEWQSGVPLAALARGLGISGAGPLYYGIQRHVSEIARRGSLS